MLMNKTHLESDRPTIVIFHIIGKDQDLRNVDELSELLVLEANIDAVALCKNAFAVVGLFHFNESQRHSVYQQGDIGSKFIIPIFASRVPLLHETNYCRNS